MFADSWGVRPWVPVALIALVLLGMAAALWAGIRYAGDSTGGAVVPVVVVPVAPVIHPAPAYRAPVRAVYRPAVVEEPEEVP